MTTIQSIFAAATTPALAIAAAHTAELNNNSLLASALADHCLMLKARAVKDKATMVRLSQRIGRALALLA